jgi:hypothetical protein
MLYLSLEVNATSFPDPHFYGDEIMGGLQDYGAFFFPLLFCPIGDGLCVGGGLNW